MVVSLLSPKGPRSRSSKIGRQGEDGHPSPRRGSWSFLGLFHLGLGWPG